MRVPLLREDLRQLLRHFLLRLHLLGWLLVAGLRCLLLLRVGRLGLLVLRLRLRGPLFGVELLLGRHG